MATGTTCQEPLTCGFCETSEDVGSYCLECKGNLCDTCTVSHARAPMYRNHNVIPLIEGLRLHAAEEECSVHRSYVCAFHCNTCHKPVCNKCITGDHKGHEISEIETILQKVQQEIKEYLEALETKYIPQCKSEEAKIKQNIAECKKVTISLKSNISNKQAGIITEVQLLCSDLIHKAEDEEKHHNLDMDKALQKLQITANKIENMITKSKEALTKLASEQIKFNQDKLSLTHLDVPKAPTFHNATFQPGTVNRAQLAVQIGDLLSSKVSILYRNKIEWGIKSVNTVDGNHAWVRVYNKYKELSLVDIDGKIIQCINTKFDITNFAVTTSGDIITTDYDSRCIRIMTQTGEVTRTINTNPNKPTGVCLGNNDLEIVVCVNTSDESSSKLVVYSRDGKEIRTINYTDEPVGIYNDERVTLNIRGDYCISHHDHRKVYVVDNNGALRHTYDGSGAGKMKEKFLPFDVCSDMFNHLFISDYNNHKIHMLDDGGKFLRFILTERDGLTKPSGLCIDKDGRFWLGQWDGGIYIVKYLQ